VYSLLLLLWSLHAIFVVLLHFGPYGAALLSLLHRLELMASIRACTWPTGWRTRQT
jgi:hypothetical protein